MNPARRTCLSAVLACLLAHLASAEGASFDCERARSKLNRLICSDADLSRLDEVVWNAYGERIRGLSPLQYAHVRERHLQWRRSRGLYENTVEALKHEYHAHHAWLTHPLLWLDGRYQRSAPGASTAHIEIDIDTRSPDGVELRGMVLLAPALPWEASARLGQGAPGAAAGMRLTLNMQPMLTGNDAALTPDCRFDISFDGDDAHLTASAPCGRAFDGKYSRVARE